MYLLIDIGNTAIKFANYDGQEINHFLTLPSQNLIIEKHLLQKINAAFNKIGITWAMIKLICLSSVRPMWDGIIRDLASNHHLAFYQLKKNLVINDFTINVPNPHNLGTDLLAVAYASYHEFNKNDSIVINMGTATTITMVKDHQFEGTVIMPGLATASEALFSRAQLLQQFEISYEGAYIGKNTKQAINIGLVKGHGLAIKALVDEIVVHLKNPIIVITGGNSYHFDQLLSNYLFDKLLLFKGLVYALHHNNLIK